YFHKELENDIYEEDAYIEKHSKKLDKKTIDNALKDKINFKKHLTQIIENIYIHKSEINDYELLKSSSEEYINGDKYKAIFQLEKFLENHNTPDYYPKDRKSTRLNSS